MKEQIQRAFDLAKNEVEEKEIKHLKTIIKNLLEEKNRLEKNKDELEEQIKVVKQDIDDFKSGRLDKVKERHDKNPHANVVAPINIVIINDNSRKNYPQKPWMWNYEVNWGLKPLITTGIAGDGNIVYSTGDSNLVYSSSTGCATKAVFNGNCVTTFTSGTYLLSDGSITNL